MTTTTAEFSRMICGCDLGFMGDPSSFCAIKQTSRKNDAGRSVPHYQLLHLHKWPLRTAYTAIVADLKKLFEKNPFSGERNPLDQAVLVLDKTGVGVPVYQQVVQAKINASHVVGLSITAGSKDGPDTAAKANLVSGLIRVWGEKRFELAELPLTGALLRELESFRAKTTAARNITYSAASGAADDLISAVSLAVNYGERLGVPQGGRGPGVHTPRSPYGLDIRPDRALVAVNAIMQQVMR